MAVPLEVARIVRARAKGRCQYCQMHESLQGATFHIEHIIPKRAGGTSNLRNLTLACPSCNLHKGSRIQAEDLRLAVHVPLFNPATESWEVHFRWNGVNMEGLTSIGRATIQCLKLNSPRRMRIREVEQSFGLFPPDG